MERKSTPTRSAIILAWIIMSIMTSVLGAAPTKKTKSHEEFDELRSIAPNIFLDCERGACDMDYIRTEITFVNYVRERESADIHILVTRRRTGSGGNEYTIAFIGRKKHRGRDATLKYYSKSTDTSDEVRRGMVNMLKQGLIPYISDTPLAEFITVSYARTTQARQTSVKDKWDYWVFSTGFRGNLNFEELLKRYSYSLSLSANRTTEDMKFRIWANSSVNERRFKVSETEEIISQTRRNFAFSQLVISLNDHWSLGPSLSFFSSTFDNADLFATVGPAVEYNIFPYEESTRRELRIQYRLSFSYRDYDEISLYEKTMENLLNQSLQVTFELKETWGSMGMQLEGSNYLHDFSKNHVKLEAGLYLRVFKGLSFNIGGEYARVRDQLALPKGGSSKDEILLELKRLETTYDLRLEMGFSYRFGSIYSNVVNPRFGNR